MKGDFTRDTFDPLKHFSRVLMQQGRVQLDADWNEQMSILLHYIRTLASDLIGPYAGPNERSGFEILGVEQLPSIDVLKKVEPSLTQATLDKLKGMLDINGFLIGAGRYYVNGCLCENEGLVHSSAQPDFEVTEGDLSVRQHYLVYLDVWERHITCVEDDYIREKALGGPDTTTRTKTIWQVKVKNLGPAYAYCLNGASALDNEIAISKACLRARAKRERRPTEPCLIEPEAHYRGTENQLYRVEIHDGGSLEGGGNPTFKWSRDNGSVVFPIRGQETLHLKGKKITVELEVSHLGRDSRLSLAVGDWVELVDDTLVLLNQARPLYKVETVDPVKRTIRLTSLSETELDYSVDLTKKVFLRRWDQKQGITPNGVVPIVEGEATGWETEPAWLVLEDGIKVQFKKNGNYRAGDYWLIPARTASGDVEWPTEIAEGGKPQKDKQGNSITRFIPPNGIMHHYAPLAIIYVKDDKKVNREYDCRCSFEPLSYACPYSQYGQLGIGTDLLCP